MRRAMVAMIAALALSSACGAAQPAPDKTSGPILLVGNKGEDSLSFIALEDGRELARPKTGRMPHEIAVSPDGKQAAVVAYGGTTIDLFDVASRARIKTVDLSPNAGPHGIAWLADGRIIVTTERSKSIAIVDPATGTVSASIATGEDGTHMVAVSDDGARAYTANIGSGTVSVIDLKAKAKLRDLAVGGRPEGIALSKDGRTLWVGDLEGARVQVFDTGSFEKLGEVATGAVPIRVAASPDGRWIVSSNVGAGTLTVIDSRTRAKLRDVTVSGDGQAGQVTILFGPNGRLYAAETGRDEVAEIDLASGKVLRRLKAGKNGDGLAIVP
jgi:YVTN family beta-propeller protein